MSKTSGRMFFSYTIHTTNYTLPSTQSLTTQLLFVLQGLPHDRLTHVGKTSRYGARINIVKCREQPTNVSPPSPVDEKTIVLYRYCTVHTINASGRSMIVVARVYCLAFRFSFVSLLTIVSFSTIKRKPIKLSPWHLFCCPSLLHKLVIIFSIIVSLNQKERACLYCSDFFLTFVTFIKK